GLSVAGVGASVGLHVVLRELLHVSDSPVSVAFSRVSEWTGGQWVAAGAIPGAFLAGGRAAGGHPFRAGALLTVLVTGFFFWARSARRSTALPAGPRAGLLVAAAAVACIAPVGAAVASAPGFSPQFAYASAMGLALALGAACHFAVRGLVLARPAV